MIKIGSRVRIHWGKDKSCPTMKILVGKTGKVTEVRHAEFLVKIDYSTTEFIIYSDEIELINNQEPRIARYAKNKPERK